MILVAVNVPTLINFILTMKYFVLASLVLAIAACSQTDSKDKSKSEKVDKATLGKSIYSANCVNCHGANGKLGMSGAADLKASTLSVEERIYVITYGRKAMQPWKNMLTEEEIQAVAEYTTALPGK
jgi:cytochrome c6